jgi:hypothetical protein
MFFSYIQCFAGAYLNCCCFVVPCLDFVFYCVFFLLPPASSFLITILSGWGWGGGCCGCSLCFTVLLLRAFPHRKLIFNIAVRAETSARRTAEVPKKKVDSSHRLGTFYIFLVVLVHLHMEIHHEMSLPNLDLLSPYHCVYLQSPAGFRIRIGIRPKRLIPAPDPYQMACRTIVIKKYTHCSDSRDSSPENGRSSEEGSRQQTKNR